MPPGAPTSVFLQRCSCLPGPTAEPAAPKARASVSCCPEPEGRGSGHPGVPEEGPQALGRAGQVWRRCLPHTVTVSSARTLAATTLSSPTQLCGLQSLASDPLF